MNFINSKILLPTQNARQFSSSKLNDLNESIKKMGYNSEYPIEVILYEGKYYILDGHHRALSAAQNNLNVPIVILYETGDTLPWGETVQNFISGLNKSVFYDWEDWMR